MGLINNQRVGKDIHETFHRELDNQQDKFGVIAEYLGRRLFDKVINIKIQILKKKLKKSIFFSRLGINNMILMCIFFSMISWFYLIYNTLIYISNILQNITVTWRYIRKKTKI